MSYSLIQRHWDKKKSVQENFAALGLSYNLNPSMKYSQQGKDVLKQAEQGFGMGDDDNKDANADDNYASEDSYDANNDYFKDDGAD